MLPVYLFLPVLPVYLFLPVLPVYLFLPVLPVYLFLPVLPVYLFLPVYLLLLVYLTCVPVMESDQLLTQGVPMGAYGNSPLLLRWIL